MHMGLLLVAVSALAGTTVPTTVVSGQQQADRGTTSTPAPKLICEKQIPIGTRLGGRQVCYTPEGMASRRLQERQSIEAIQAQPCMPTHTERGMSAC